MSFTYARSAAGGWSQNWQREDPRSLGRAMFECVRHIVGDFNRKNEDVPTIFCPHNGQTSGCFGFGCELQLCESCEKTWVEYIHSREWH